MYNILVCDDDREIVDAIEIYLTQEGYHVLKAYDGMQAIQMLEREEIQLLIIDVMMPKLDGIRATLKIREKSYFLLLSNAIRFLYIVLMLRIWLIKKSAIFV